jgi:putative membrane protein
MRYILALIFAAVAALEPASAADAPSDSDFIKESYINNLKEHAVAGMAEVKSTDPRVKQFAATLSKDHLKANEDLKRVAASMVIKLPDYSDDKQSYDKLSKLTGDAFDRAFVSWTLDTHIRATATLEAQSKTAGGELKKFIERQMPVEKAHLETARALSDSFSKGAMRDVPVNDNQGPINVNYGPPEDPMKYSVPNTPQRAGELIKDAGDEARQKIDESGRRAKEFSPPMRDKSLDFIR